MGEDVAYKLSELITYDITPCPKPRMTRSDRWKQRPCVMRYWAFKDRAIKLNIKIKPMQKIAFYLPMPKSWSKKKKEAHNLQPHTTRPDTDNMIKAIFDAVHEEDSHIWSVWGEKKWAYRGHITIQDIIEIKC